MITLADAITQIDQCISEIGSKNILSNDIDQQDIDDMSAATSAMLPELAKLSSNELEPLLVGLLNQGRVYEGFVYAIVADLATDYPEVFDKAEFRNTTLQEMSAEYEEGSVLGL